MASSLSHVQLAASRQKQEYGIPRFGTLDTTTNPALIADLDSPDSLNVSYDKVGSVGTRKGYTKLLTTPTSSFIGGMYAFYKSDTTKQLLIASNTSLLKYDNAGGTTAISGTPATFTANKMWSFDEYNDTVYAGNGTSDGLIKITNTTYSVSNAGISPQIVCVHKNRVYCANKNSSTLYFSDAGNPDSFPANNFIQINTNDGQNITGIKSINDTLIIFKDDSIWSLTGDPLGAGNITTIGNLQLRRANSSVGCSAFRTIKQVGAALIFMHYSGLFVFQNNASTPISDKLNTTFQTAMNQSFIQNCWAVYDNMTNLYILGFPSATSITPDKAIVHNLLAKTQTIWDDIPGSCAITYRFSGLNASIIMGDPIKGNIYTLNQGYADIAGDNGTATGGTTTTLVDTSKSWTTNQFTDCRIKITGGTGSGSTAVVLSNTATTLTFVSAMAIAPAAGSTYSIGYYNSYWKTKVFDFGHSGYDKKYRFFNLFIDAVPYNIKFGSAFDFQPLAYQKSINLSNGSLTWGVQNTWGTGNWGYASSEFVQANIGGTGRYIQAMFGNDLANQPWNIFNYSISYKMKKMRANITSV
jgi:hypothetical protein